MEQSQQTDCGLMESESDVKSAKGRKGDFEGDYDAPPIYLDYNATTPIDPEVAKAMLPFLHVEFGNPSSSHFYGRRAKLAVEKARRSVAALIGCYPDEVLFTSGGTEANNWAIKCGAKADMEEGGRRHLVTSSIEHPAVSEVIDYLCNEEGFCKTVVPVDSEGRVDVEEVAQAVAMANGPALVSIMHANNEVGTLQPIDGIAAALHGYGNENGNAVFVHTDASQSVGKIPIDWPTLGVDFLTIAGHKLYAPKGVGALIVRRGIRLPKFLHGAGHERGKRAGTENVLLIVGLGKACEVAQKGLERNMRHMRAMRDRLRAGLEASFSELRKEGLVTDDILRMNGPTDPDQQLPNTLSLSIKGVDSGYLHSAISPYIACSSGSACHAGHLSISPVLSAMGVDKEFASCTLRLSTGKNTTASDIDIAIEAIASAVRSLV